MKIELFISALLFGCFIYGQTIIDNVSELPVAVKNAKAGETIVLTDGEYNVDLVLEGYGAIGDSIIIKSQNNGGVILKGNVVLVGEYLVFKGFRFQGSSYNVGDSVKINSTIKLEKLKYSNIAENQFINVGRSTAGTSDVVIGVFGSTNIQIQNNYFFGSKANCVYVAPPSQNILIMRNVFAETPRAKGNRWEMVKINYRIKDSRYETKVIVSGNIFLNYLGDGSEVISLKASRNYILDNLFYICDGDVTFRQGTENIVSGNVFYKSAGVRISGKNQMISNNYFINSIRSPITIMSGDKATKNPVYEPASNVSIINNFVREYNNPAMTIGLGPEKYNVSPKDIVIANNEFIIKDSDKFIDWRDSDRFDFSPMNKILSDSVDVDINKILFERNIVLPDSIRFDFR